MASTSVVPVLRQGFYDKKNMTLQITEDNGSSADYRGLECFYGATSLGLGDHEYIVKADMSQSFIMLNYRLYPVPKMWKCKLPKGDDARFLHFVVNHYKCLHCSGYYSSGTELTELPEQVKLYCAGNLEHKEQSVTCFTTIGYESFDVLSEKQLHMLRWGSEFGSDIVYKLRPR